MGKYHLPWELCTVFLTSHFNYLFHNNYYCLHHSIHHLSSRHHKHHLSHSVWNLYCKMYIHIIFKFQYRGHSIYQNVNIFVILWKCKKLPTKMTLNLDFWRKPQENFFFYKYNLFRLKTEISFLSFFILKISLMKSFNLDLEYNLKKFKSFSFINI